MVQQSPHLRMSSHPEIMAMLDKIKDASKLHIFRPVEDLCVIPDDEKLNQLVRTHSRPIENELETHVIKSRQGTVLSSDTILKIDSWKKEGLRKSVVEGANHFRKIESLDLYGVAQPTVKGMRNSLSWIKKNSPHVTQVFWINLREEPLIYINGVPYVLRDHFVTLRNIKSYSGIASERLDLIENKLNSDVLNECQKYYGKVLLVSTSF